MYYRKGLCIVMFYAERWALSAMPQGTFCYNVIRSELCSERTTARGFVFYYVMRGALGAEHTAARGLI